MFRHFPSLILGAWFAVVPIQAQCEAPAVTLQSAIPAQALTAALETWSKQSGIQVMYAMEVAQGLKSQGAPKGLAASEALKQILSGTGLTFRRLNDRSVSVVPEREAAAERELAGQMRVADASSPGAAVAEDPPAGEALPQKGVPEILVRSARGPRGSMNTDIERTEDDIQPYVVFSREELEGANVANLEEFFRTRLPMNNTTASQPVNQTFPSPASQISLRGLSAQQTLILIDGRRAPPRASGASGLLFAQADINGIPLSMIERIEILPSTASGIYGGGATGGVINIITRRDHRGVEATLSYTNTFEADSALRRADLNGSFSLEGGRTFLSLSSSYSDGNQMMARDRQFAVRARALQLANNPAAIYTATTPPLGYTPNIRSQNGSSLVLKSQYGGTALNSPITHVPVGYAGLAAGGVAPLVANAGKYNLDLAESFGTGGMAALGSAPRVRSLSVSARRGFGARVETYVDFSSQDNHSALAQNYIATSVTLPVSATDNPFTVPVVVAWAPTGLRAIESGWSENDRAIAGMVIRLPKAWTAGLDYGWARSRNATLRPAPPADPDGAGPLPSLASALASGTLEVMRDTNAYPLNFEPYRMPRSHGLTEYRLTSEEWTLRASGPAWEAPGGPVTLSGNVAWREEHQPGDIIEVVTQVPTTYTWFPPAWLQARSAYLEARVPVFAGNDGGFLRGLELQASARYDEFRLRSRARSVSQTIPGPTGPFPTVDFFDRRLDAVSETVGLKFEPLPDLTVRASWGTGYLPPTLGQLAEAAPFSIPGLSLIDMKREKVLASTGAIQLQDGGDPGMRPELSESVSAGLILRPRRLPGLRLSLDFTRIEKTDEIASLSFQQILDFEDAIPGRIQRAALTPQEQALGYSAGRITLMKFGSVNVAGKKITAYDIQTDYDLETANRGSFSFHVIGTYQPQLATRPAAGYSYIETIGYTGGLRWRGNAAIDWNRGGWSAGWNLQYYDSYFGFSSTTTAAGRATYALNQGSEKIPSQRYHDLTVGYRLQGGSRAGWRSFSDVRVTLGVQNVFDTAPPILATTSTSGNFSGYGDPRLRRYTLTIRGNF